MVRRFFGELIVKLAETAAGAGAGSRFVMQCEIQAEVDCCFEFLSELNL